MSRKIAILLLVVFIGGLLFPFLTLAGQYESNKGTVFYKGLVPCGKTSFVSGESKLVTAPCQLCHIFVMIDGIIDFVTQKIVPSIVVLMMIIAGIMFFFAGGNPTLMLQAKKLITSVVIGLVIIFSAFLIIQTILKVMDVAKTNPLSEWVKGNAFTIHCPIEYGEDVTGNGNGGDDWSNAEKYEVENPDDIICTPIDISHECEAGFKLNKAKCEPGDNTKVIESKQIVGKEGWYCKFQGKTSGWELCFPPKGTLYLDCIDDPDYVPPEEVTEWYERDIGPSNTEEIDGTKKCEKDYQIADDGECIPAAYSTTTKSEKTSDGKGWYCKFKSIDEPWVSGYSAPAAGTIRVHCVPE